MKRTALRRYAWMKPRSDKVVKAQPSFQAVYDEVDRRSEGRCEWANLLATGELPLGVISRMYARCPRRATEHHHTIKPRRSHHTAELVVHLCHQHHDRCAWRYERGKAIVWPLGRGRFMCEVVYAKDKFAARGQG